MVIILDEKDTPESIAKKLASLKQSPKQLTRTKSIAHLCGAVKWEEDAVAYQKRLRDEWE